MSLFRRVLFPLIILLVVLLAIMISNKSASGDYRPTIACMNDIYRAESTPADVLMMGSSRSVAGIVNPYLRFRLQEMNSRASTVDTIFIGGSDQVSKAGVAVEYLDSVGAPEVLILENMFVQKGKEMLDQYKDVPFIDPTPSTLRYTHWWSYGRIQSAMLKNSDVGLMGYLDARHMNAFEFWSQQSSYALYELLKSPEMVGKPLKDACTNKTDHRGPADPYKSTKEGPKNLSAAVRSSWEKAGNLAKAKPYTEKKKKKITREVREYKTLVPDDPNRAFDISAMKQIIEMFKAAGTKEIFIWVPGDYLMTYDPDFEAYLEQEYVPSGATRIYHKKILDLYDAADRDKIFRNGNHVNIPGRVILTDFWAREISEISKP